MKIAVLGAGAMGSIFGGRLSHHHEVWLIDIWQEHITAINAQGLQIEENGQQYCFQPQAVPNAQKVGPVDLVIIFVKSIDTATALSMNRELFDPQTMVLTLQNGWGNAEDILQHVRAENLLLGTTAEGGYILSPGCVCHAGHGQTLVGARTADGTAKAQIVVKALREAGFEVTLTDDANMIIWKKLLINAAINPLTALLNSQNGYLTESEFTLELLEQIVREAVAVANAAGMAFDVATVLAEVKQVAQLTGANRSSMLQDVTKKRKTEIDRINGAIASQGQSAAIPTPCNTMLVQLIKALEGTYL